MSLVFSRVSRVLLFSCARVILHSLPPLAHSTGKPTNGSINYFGTNIPKRKNNHTQAYYDKKAALKRKRSEQQEDNGLINGGINHISLQRTNRLYTTGGHGRLPSERRVGGGGREKQRALEAAKKQRALDAELKELARVAQVRI